MGLISYFEVTHLGEFDFDALMALSVKALDTMYGIPLPHVSPYFIHCRVVANVTTTSISSRERPRARGAALGPTPTSKTVATPSNTTASIVLTRQHSNSPPTKARPISRLEMPAHEVKHLSVDPQLRSQSKSWDSGLDMFGAVPFSTPKQVSSSVERYKLPTSTTLQNWPNYNICITIPIPLTAGSHTVRRTISFQQLF